MIRKAYIFAGVLLLSASSVVANTGYKCDRVHLMSTGFTSRAFAEKQFPKKMWVVYSKDGKIAASWYGISKKRAKVHRENGMSTFKRQGGWTINFRHYDFDRKKNQLQISMTYPGYVEAAPHKYNCGPAEETDWWPEED
jgi:hypothetical protein